VPLASTLVAAPRNISLFRLKLIDGLANQPVSRVSLSQVPE